MSVVAIILLVTLPWLVLVTQVALLIAHLNPVFDPYLADRFNRLLGPSVPSRRFGRASIYALFIIFPSIRRRYGIDLNMRSMVPHNIYQACQVYIFTGSVTTLVFLGIFFMGVLR